MKVSKAALSLVSATFVMVFGLSGCANFGTGLAPASSAEGQIGPIQGNVYGGHAPIIGANVFVMQVGLTGYGSKATSLIQAGTTGTAAYPVVQDTVGTAATNPTFGLYGVKTATDGTFNITGDYACTAGDPVFLFADGGSPTYPSSSNIFTTNQIVVSNYNALAATATYTFTTTTTENFYIGEVIGFTGYSGTFAGLNSTSAQVIATGLTTTTFAVNAPDTTVITNGTYTVTGTSTANPTTNASVDNIAVLGVCPAGGSFASTIKYVYMNEVSTVAAAYALAAFADTTVNNDALHIGIPASNAFALQSIQNAALTTNNLYDIQGGNTSTTYAGEGHIARSVTPAGNGTVPQTLLDTLGNILAACVDSNNSYNRKTSSGTLSSACSILFTNATSDATSTGTNPKDTATAAINIAHHPNTVSNANYVTNLYNIPSGNVPFVPDLIAAPADFVVAINYTGGGLNFPLHVAIDALGNAWVPNYQGNTITEFSPVGAFLSGSTGFAGNGLNGPDHLAIDTSGFIWVDNFGGGNSIAKLNTNGTAVAGSPFAVGPTPRGITFGLTGNLWVSNYNSTAGTTVSELNSAGANVTGSPFSGGGLSGPVGAVTDSLGDIWFANVSGNSTTKVVPGTTPTLTNYNGGGQNSANELAIDATNNVWIANYGSNSISKLSNAGVAASGSPFSGGGQSSTVYILVDGANTIWVAGTGGVISEFSNAGTAITTTAGYKDGNLNGSYGMAVDGSGNLWIANYVGNTVSEYVGIATPVLTPTISAVAAGKIGVKP